MTQASPFENHHVRLCACQTGGPLWDRDGEIRPVESLPVSPILAGRIRDWGERYRREDDRPGVAFDIADFTTQGRGIARAIKAELPAWTVVYSDEARARDADDPRRCQYEITL